MLEIRKVDNICERVPYRFFEKMVDAPFIKYNPTLTLTLTQQRHQPMQGEYPLRLVHSSVRQPSSRKSGLYWSQQ